jgi:hypothetical protein
MISINHEDRERLIKLLGMLGSEHIGERAVAAKKIEQLRTEMGFDWEALIVADVGRHGTTPPVETKGADTALPLDLLDGYSQFLSSWEKDFLIDLDKKRGAGLVWTERQRAKLMEIAIGAQSRVKGEPPARKYRAFGGSQWR